MGVRDWNLRHMMRRSRMRRDRLNRGGAKLFADCLQRARAVRVRTSIRISQIDASHRNDGFANEQATIPLAILKAAVLVRPKKLVEYLLPVGSPLHYARFVYF